ncbi:MAG: hypothetical protein IJM41_04010 [Bacteroidales bacterium]|nr:hypothetical protein [Bacteroidales bacterium]
MKEKRSALFSRYILDGVQQDRTPMQMLEGSLSLNADRGSIPEKPEAEPAPIADETVDPSLSPLGLDESCAARYLDEIRSAPPRQWPHAFSAQFTKALVARTLIDAIWRKGEFTLPDLVLKAEWKWRSEPIGNMASFYASVQAACEYVDTLGTGFESYGFKESRGGSSLTLKVGTTESRPSDFEDDDSFIAEAPTTPEEGLPDPMSETAESGTHPRIMRSRKCPDTAVPDRSSWIIYIPFESCDYRLGGSLFSSATGISGEIAPEMDDPDYFLDCYEVVRELIEDGIVIAGRTVADGGLLCALDSFLGNGPGMDCDLSDIGRASGEQSLCHILFSEVPGVLVQINDNDYDYLDAELLLQDVAYYTLGHPDRDRRGADVHMKGRPLIAGILEALLRSDTSEGED